MPAAGNDRKARVLIVDDDRVTARLLEFMLTKHGYQVAVATDGQRGLEMLGTYRPDAVLLDLQMPNISGQEVLRQIRLNSRYDQTVIIVLTATSFEVEREKVFEMGADAHCTKPIAPATLVRELHQLLVPPSIQESGRVGGAHVV